MAKYLCICQYGHSRSVCLTRVLHGLHHEAVAVGVGTSPSALALLAEWADYVAVLDNALDNAVRRNLPQAQHHKIRSYHVGPDRWVNPYNQELQLLLEGMHKKKVSNESA